jgi:hypothetical protein
VRTRRGTTLTDGSSLDRTDDLMELSKFGQLTADEVRRKTKEREATRAHVESVGRSLGQMLERVCSTTAAGKCGGVGRVDATRPARAFVCLVSSCLSVDLPTGPAGTHVNDALDLFICQLCDDADTRHIRSLVHRRYEQLVSLVDKQLENIRIEQKSRNDDRGPTTMPHAARASI